jgi:spore coat polysaccharide biosynthesis predicted glycosyltransferase SpsG
MLNLIEKILQKVKLYINGDRSIISHLKNINFELINWSKEINFNSLIKEDIIIIDSTLVDLNIFKSIKSKFYFIDDSRRYDYSNRNCIIIDWTPGVEKKYHINNNFKLGIKYITLRKIFWDTPTLKINKSVKNILITMVQCFYQLV